MQDARLKVLYVAGVGRSGSTILGALLGQVDGFFFGGEIGALFKGTEVGAPGEGVTPWLCGCGAPLAQCPLWREVLGSGSRDLDLRTIYEQGAGWRPSLVVAPPPPGFQRYLEQLYQSIRRVTRSHVIVDTSKSVAYGRVLSRLPSIDLYVVHLVRDPRAVAFSWGRLKPSPRTGGHVPRKPAAKSAVEWLAYNAATELALCGRHAKHLRLRYEDFIARPGETLDQLLRWLGDGAAPPRTEGRVALRVCHTVAGNIDRFRTGEVELRCDEEWTHSMGWIDRHGVSLVTSPLRWRYGYRRTRGRASPPSSLGPPGSQGAPHRAPGAPP